MAFESIKHAFHNNIPLALEMGMHPFGPEPLRFDTFSISSPEIFSKKNAEISLTIKLSSEKPEDENNLPILAWEYFDGSG